MPKIQFMQSEPVDEWHCVIDNAGLSPLAKKLLLGMQPHIVECLFRVLEVHQISPNDRTRLGELLREVDERLRSRAPTPKGTPENWMPSLTRILDTAYWSTMTALHYLEEDVTETIHYHTQSVYFLTHFNDTFHWFDLVEKMESAVDARTKKLIDPTVIGKIGAQVRWSSRNVVKEFALERFGERNWKSKADGVRRILPAVCEKADEIGFAYASTNIERTIHDWIRSSTTSSS